MQVCVVEGHPELLDRRTRPYYRAFGEGATRSRFVVCQEREVTPRHSPFGLRATPARQGPSSAVGARGGTPPVRAPPSPRAGGGESRGLVSELERREKRDRQMINGAFATFAGVVIYVFAKRLPFLGHFICTYFPRQFC